MLRAAPTRPKRKRRHIPHRLRPTAAVDKRNERERRRVNDVNSAFVRLRDTLGMEKLSDKRLSKINILTNAIDYISNLSQVLDLTVYGNANNARNSDHERVEHQQTVTFSDKTQGSDPTWNYTTENDKYDFNPTSEHHLTQWHFNYATSNCHVQDSSYDYMQTFTRLELPALQDCIPEVPKMCQTRTQVSSKRKQSFI